MRRSSQYRFLVGLSHSGCFERHYLQVLSMGLTGCSVAQKASGHSTFLTGKRTRDLRVQKHVVKATVYPTRLSSSSVVVVIVLVAAPPPPSPPAVVVIVIVKKSSLLPNHRWCYSQTRDSTRALGV